MQVANFVVSGLLLAFFSLGLHLGTTNGHRSTRSCSPLRGGDSDGTNGLRDRSDTEGQPRSLHGLIHDAAFVIFVLAFLAALFSLWRRFEAWPPWRGHALTPWPRGY